MKLNDPFGRVAHREQKEYESLSKTLKNSGVNTRQEAETVIERLRTRRTSSVYVVLIVMMVLVFFYPKAFFFFLIFAALILLWVFKTTQNARKYIQRYIEEELSENNEPQ